MMTILAVTTKGLGGTGGGSEDNQWVTEYDLATIVNGQTIYYNGPLDNLRVISFITDVIERNTKKCIRSHFVRKYLFVLP